MQVDMLDDQLEFFGRQVLPGQSDLESLDGVVAYLQRVLFFQGLEDTPLETEVVQPEVAFHQGQTDVRLV